MTLRLAHPARWLALALLAIACDPGGSDPSDLLHQPTQAQQAEEPSERARALLEPFGSLRRLGPHAFGLRGAPLGRAVAAIGGESRAVVAAPETLPVFSAFELAPKDGVVSAHVPAEALGRLPAGGTSLRVQTLPAGASTTLAEQLAHTTFSKRVRDGWTLHDDGTGATLEWRPRTPLAPGTAYALHVDAVARAPGRLESQTFGAPAGARIEVAYGLTTRTSARGFSPVRFRSALRCRGDAERVLLDRSIGEEPNPGWQDVSFAFPEARDACTLVLTSRDAEGEPARGAAFAVPRIVPAPPPPGPNLVLVSLDTLRADHLSGYGYPRATSPRIDAELIARGATFWDVSATYTRTDVSHMSIFSGLYGEARPEPRRLAASTPIPLLAERLRDAGFETAAFTENGLVAGEFGFHFGFDRYVEFTYDEVRQGASPFAEARAYLEARGDRRFFLFVHTYKTHTPYASGDAYQSLFADPADWERSEMDLGVKPRGRATADAYDRTIREADDLVGGLLDALARLGLEERTLVVLLSDHGEALTEHGAMGHSYTRFQEVLRVPLVLRGPGVPKGLRVETPVSLVDVTPTLLDLLELPPIDVTQGTSLVPALRGEALPADRPLYFSWLADEALGVRRGQWKYTHGGRQELYDLSADPGERTRLALSAFPEGDALLGRHREASAQLRERYLAGIPDTDPTRSSDEISEETEEALRALGYVE